jgi:hypothetical protein
MRRLAIWLVTACGVALLSGCSGGTGFGNSGSSLTNIVFSNGSGEVNDFFVAPNGIAPVSIAAVGVKGTGAFEELVYGQSFTWSARFVDPDTDPASIATYKTGVAPATFKKCPAAPLVQPAVPILEQNSGGAGTGYAGYADLPAGQAASTVFIGAVHGVPAPYCLVVTATHPSDGTVGSVTVVVSSSP